MYVLFNLGPLLEFTEITAPGFAHLDFVFAKDAGRLVNRRILRLLYRTEDADNE